MKDYDLYIQRAEEARSDADDAVLANVRDRCLRAEAAWKAMADRAARTENMRASLVENNAGVTEPMTINVSRVDEHFLDTMGISIKTGRGFASEMADKSSGAIVNEALVRARGWSDPLGKQIFDSQNGPRRVIGVM